LSEGVLLAGVRGMGRQSGIYFLPTGLHKLEKMLSITIEHIGELVFRARIVNFSIRLGVKTGVMP